MPDLRPRPLGLAQPLIQNHGFDMTTRKKDIYQPPEDALWLLPLGGSGEIGMNMNLYGTAGKWLMVDCGVMFADETTPGIDIITPDASFIVERRDDLLGIVVTHAHEDHLGAIDRLWPRLRCPVYATPFAAALLRNKFEQADLLHDVRIIEIPTGGSFTAGPFEVEMINVTHSVPEAQMLAIKTAHGKVLHTGDWKLDDEPIIGSLTNDDRLRELGREGIMALVGDSTGATVPAATPSEIAVQGGLRALFPKYKHRIAVTCFSSNIARIKSIAMAAKETGRYVALVGRSLWRNAEVAYELGYLPEYEDFLSEHEAMQCPRDKIVLVCTGCQGEPRSALTRIAVFDHPTVRLERGDIVVYSSREIPGNEKPIARVQNLLVKQRVDIVTIDNAMVHASGHAGQPDMKRLYEWVKPQLSVPVHGELRHQVEHARLARTLGVPATLVPTDGQIIRLGPGIHEIVAEVKAGRWGLDGIHLRPVDQEVSKNRRKMNFNGAAVVTLAIDKRGEIVSDPQITLLGVEEAGAAAQLREEMAGALLDEMEKMPRSVLLDDQALKTATTKTIRRFLQESQGKKPIVEVHLIRL